MSGQIPAHSFTDAIRPIADQLPLQDDQANAPTRPQGWTQAHSPEELQQAMARTFTILLFGPLVQAGGGERIPVTLATPQPTCADLRTALAAQCPGIARLLPSCRFAVNHAFVAETIQLNGDEEIALIGFVAGG